MFHAHAKFARRVLGALLGVALASVVTFSAADVISPAHYWRNTWQGDDANYGSAGAAMSGGGAAYCADPRNASLSGCAPQDNGYISIQEYEGGPWNAVGLISVYDAYVCPAGYQLYPSWTENGVTYTPACQRDDPAPPPPPPMPPLGCASGEGGFLACPSPTAPGGSPTGPKQNIGDSSKTSSPMEGPVEPWTSPFITVLGGSNMCKPPDAVGDPVMAGTGNVFHSEVDYAGAGPRFVRSYNSGSPGWVHNHMIRVIANSILADVVRPDGQMLTFTGSGDGAWRSNATVVEQLERLPGGWRFTTADDTVEVFDAAGLPVSSAPRHGRATRYETANGRVQAVIDPWGRRLVIQYDGSGRVGSVLAPDGQRIVYAYDAGGRLGMVTYADGTTRRYAYENASQPLLLTGVIDETGTRFASWNYDAQGRAVSAVQAEAANRALLSYSGSQTAVVDGLGKQRSLSFASVQGRVVFGGHDSPCANCIGDAAQRSIDPASGLVTRSVDFLGRTTAITWDSARRLPLTETRAVGYPEQQRRTTQWHPLYRLPMRVDEGGRFTVFTYDSRGNKTHEAVTDTSTGETRTTEWAYSSAGLVTSMKEPGGAVWEYEHDGTGQLIAVRDPESNRTTFTYDAAGRVAARTDANGLVTSFGYDVRGRLIAAEAAGETTVLTYHPTGQLRSLTLPNGVQFGYGYDGAHRLVEVRDSRGAVVKYTLDAMGNRVREDVHDGNGNVVLTRSRTVNALNRISAELDSQGRGTLIGYDTNGEAISTIDALGQITTQSLDALGRVTRTAFADEHFAEQAWNALDQVTRVTDPKGVATQYSPNAYGDVSRESSPDIGAVTSTIDAGGSVTEEVDATGRRATYTRDRLKRPTRIAYSDQSHTFSYDAAGRVQQVTDGSGETSFTRDARGRVVRKVQVIEGVSHGVDYHYANGELASMRYPDGLQLFLVRAGGRVTQMDVQPPGHGAKRVPFLTGIQYNALGQPTAWTWANGDKAQRTFDTNGRLTASEIASLRYDAAGRITGITQQLWTQVAKGNAPLVQTPVTWTAGYDNRNRLTSFRRDGTASTFTYDANGNRTSAVEAASGALDLEGLFATPTSSQTISQTHSIDPASNRLLGFTQSISGTNGTATTSSLSRVAYGIDAAGSITSDGLRTFEHDGSGRLAKTVISRNGEAAAVVYRHDAFGQRVFKSEPVVEDTLPNEDQLGKGFIDWLKSNFGGLFGKGKASALPGMAFVYDEAGNLLAETDQGGSISRKTDYIWLPLDGGAHVLVGMYKDGQFYAVHADHLGTPRLVTDARGKPVWQWPYSAFGGNRPIGVLESAASGTTTFLRGTAPGIEMNVGMPGQYRDWETGLYYNGFRTYSAVLGRYVQADPIGLAGGTNRFTYGNGNPLAFMDPWGLAACTYSISTHTLICSPDRGGGAQVLGPSGVFSGRGNCRDNSSSGCISDVDDGPIVPGKYKMNPDHRPGHDSYWRLEPNPSIAGWKCAMGLARCGFMLHPGRVSLGCITAKTTSPEAIEQYQRIDEMLRRDARRGYPNRLTVLP